MDIKFANRFLTPQPNAKVPMRLKFLHWLFVYAAAAFIASLALSFAFQTRSARREVEHMIRNKIAEAKEHAQHAIDTLEKLTEITGETGKMNARVVAVALEHDSSIIVPNDDDKTTENLGALGRLLGIDEIDIFNGDGICVATWPKNATTIGYDCHKSEHAKEFLALIDYPNLEISQPIRSTEGSAFSGKYQFSAVPRRDEPGFCEIGFKASEVEKAYQLADVSRYVSASVGSRGFLSVFQNGIQKSGPAFSQELDLDELPLEEVKARKLNGVSHLVFAEKFNDMFFVGGVPTKEIFYSQCVTLALLILANFVIFFVVFVLVSTLVQRLIVDSVYAVNRSLEKITNGDLHERVDVAVSKEFVELSNGVNATVDSLRQVVDKIKQRAQEELLLAQKIQEASLPNLEELFPDKRYFDVYGKNLPMTSIGGDMFDFLMIDADNALFYVADVSGHGVPGALVMMKTMALVKNLAVSRYPLEKVVATTNRYLSENNDSSFVTGFFCLFNLKTGVMSYVDAGHNSPFIRRKGGKFEEFEPDVNLILGIDPDAEYAASTTTLEPGDSFVLYSDGITEANTPESTECFETTRALDTLNSLSPTASSKECVDALFNAVAEYTNFANPSDDQTALVFKYAGRTS